MDFDFFTKCALLILCGVSALMDIYTWKIRNIWVYSWMAVGLLLRGICLGKEALAGSLIGMVIPLLLLGFFFYFRLMGAGDIKLFCAVGAWMGEEGILMCMLWSFITGALIAVVKLMAAGNRKEKIHVAVPVFFGVLLKVLGVY